MANSHRDSSRIHGAPHQHVHATVEEDEDDGWQVVSSSKDSHSVSSKASSSSSPSTEDDHPIPTATDIPASEASVVSEVTFKEKPPKAKKKIFGTDEFQPVVSKKQIARANKLVGVQRPNASVGISTSSYFDLLQDTEGTEDVEEIVDRIREEEEEKARLLLEEQEQEREQEKAAANIKEILEKEEAKKEAEFRAQQVLEQRQRQLEEEEEAKEQLLQQIAQQELKRAREEEEKLAAAAVEAEQKKQKEDKKQQQKKEKREKELKEKEAAAAAATAAAAAAESAQKDVERVQVLAKDTHEDEDTTEESTKAPILDTVASPEDDSWDVEEDDEWQQQSKSKKGRKTRGTQPGESSISDVSGLQTKMPIYLLEQDEIQQDSDEEEEVSEEEQQRRDEEKAKAAAKAKAKAASNKKNKKKNNSNSNSAVSSPRMESRKKSVSTNSSAVNSPRLEGKKAKKTTTAPVTVTAVEESDAAPKLVNRSIKSGSSTAEKENKSQEKEAAEVQATVTEEGSTSMVSKDGSAGMVGGTLNSIFEKGVNPGLIKMLNLVFVALFLSLGFLIFASGGNLHVVALTGIAVALFVAVQWFLREMETMKIDERKNV